jgi:ubiquinone/menaquinone biosynthesis C-methylase UbiE
MMNFYEKYILPRITNWLCGHKTLTQQRKKVVPLAKGRVLEIGFGSGLNLGFYDPGRVQHVWGLDSSAAMLQMAAAATAPFGVECIHASAESIPLAEASADTILVTYTLCSVPNVIKALKDMRRVLKPGGELLFCEHGAAPDANIRKWQDRLNPVWSKLAGGCNLNRSIPALLEQGGFKVQTVDTMFLPVWRPAAFNYLGTAV